MAARAAADHRHDGGLCRFHPADRLQQAAARHHPDAGTEPRHPARRAADRLRLDSDHGLRALDQQTLRPSRRRRAPLQTGSALMQTGETNVVAMAGFAIFIGLSLVITWFAA